jgi:ubiquinone/menaquinone biosynthesis C-methylase UbiE
VSSCECVAVVLDNQVNEGQDIMDVPSFVRLAREYQEELRHAIRYDELEVLWRKTNFPYRLTERDPFSQKYRDEVEHIYFELAGTKYETENEIISVYDGQGTLDGYPWNTGRLDVVSSELAKVCQAMSAIHAHRRGQLEIIEFGVGWGNLAVPLAKSGQAVTVVDINKGFLDRFKAICEREEIQNCTTLHCDFTSAAAKVANKYDVIIFQASFHHCIDFDRLLDLLVTRVLKSDGMILFISEPIFEDYPFPWGLRFCGESLWAIMQNKWIELGFSQDFFSRLMINKGLFLSKVAHVAGFTGLGWKAQRMGSEHIFNQWVLPLEYDQTFHPAGDEVGRFCRATSKIPGLIADSHYEYALEFYNFAPIPLSISVQSGVWRDELTVQSGVSANAVVPVGAEPVVICSATYVPDSLSGNGDKRELGISILRIGFQEDRGKNEGPIP